MQYHQQGNSAVRQFPGKSLWVLAIAGSAMGVIQVSSHSVAPGVMAMPIVISHELWTKSQQGTDIKARVPMLSAHAQRILGENAVRRFGVFQQYSAGWDSGRGEPLSPASTAALEYFLNHFDEFSVEPSLFLTTAGNLQLIWEDRNGKAIELDFYGNYIVSYIEQLEQESRIPLDIRGVKELVGLIK